MIVRPFRTLLATLLLGALATGCATKADTDRTKLPQPNRELALPGTGYLKVFPNGLRLFVVPDPFTRLVQFDVRQRVGSRDDPDGKAGMAHFVEHLMFQIRAEGPDSPKLMSDIQQHALSFNAYTSGDETHYMHTGTADELERYMKYTAVRLGYDCEAVDENSFLREREVVRNEHRWRGEQVDAFVRDRVLELAFPEGHPYRQKTLGEDKQLASITPEDACEFTERYYTASQATVIVTGDIDPNDVLELANEYLRPLPKRKVPRREAVPPPKFAKKRAQIVAPVKKPTAIVLFSVPPRFTKDYAASQAALETMFLAIGFFTNVTERRTVVKRWYPAFFGGKQAPLFGVAVETEKPEQLEQAIDEVLDAITRGFSAKLEGKDYEGSYDSARQRARLGVLDPISNVLSRANTYAEYLAQAKPVFYGAELAALDSLTPERAQQVGRKYFARKHAMVVKVVPTGEDKPKVERASFDYQPNDEENLSIPDDIDPAEAERPLPLKDITPPDGQSLEYELENGMRVVLVQSTQMPVMDVQVIVGAGMVDAPRHRELAQMAATAYGTREGNKEAANLMTFFDRAGGIFFSNVGPTSTTFRSRGLSIYLDFIIAGVAERIVQAEYRTGALEGYRQGRKEQLKKKSALQAAKRENIFYTALYGDGHPHVREVIADRRALRELKLRDLEEFRETHYRAANSAIIVTGGFDMGLATQYVEAFFGKPRLRDRKNPWQEPKATAARPKAREPKPGRVRHMTEVDKERVQVTVTIAYPLAEAYGDDHAALAVMANMLNFGVSTVRQQLGSSYGIYARLDTGRPRIEVGGALDSERAGKGLKVIRRAIQGLRDHEDFERRFAFARRNVLRAMINAQGDPQLLAGQLAQALQNGRSYEYFRELARKVATLKPSDVKAQIKRVLKDKRSVTLVQGPTEGVEAVVSHNGIEGAKVLPEVVHDED